MTSGRFYLATLIGLVSVAALVSCQSSTQPPNELRLRPDQPTDNVNPDSNNGQQLEQQVQPNNQQQQQQQQSINDDNQLQSSTQSPFSSTQLSTIDLDDQSNNNQQFQQQGLFDPLGLFQPPRPFFQQQQPFGNKRRPSSLFDLLGQDMFEPFHRSTELMDKQFKQLEKQAAEGQEVSYFSRNGVSYVRTCTTKRVDGSSNRNNIDNSYGNKNTNNRMSFDTQQQS